MTKSRNLIAATTGALLVTGLAIGIVATSENDGDTAATHETPHLVDASAASPASSPAETSPAGEVTADSIRATVETMISPEDPIPYRDGDGPVVHVARANMVKMMIAHMSRVNGLPYESRDLLAPVQDDEGTVVAYEAVQIGRFLSPAEVSQPGFDLCALQVKALEEADATPSDRQATGTIPSARERLGC
jgi:hypothetical protein